MSNVPAKTNGAPLFAAVVECDVLATRLSPRKRAAYFHGVEQARAHLHHDLSNYEFEYRVGIGETRTRLFQGDIASGEPYRATVIKFRRDFDRRVLHRLAQYAVEVQTILGNCSGMTEGQINVAATELRAKFNQEESN